MHPSQPSPFRYVYRPARVRLPRWFFQAISWL